MRDLALGLAASAFAASTWAWSVCLLKFERLEVGLLRLVGDLALRIGIGLGGVQLVFQSRQDAVDLGDRACVAAWLCRAATTSAQVG